MVLPIYEGTSEFGQPVIIAGCGWSSTQSQINPALWTYNPGSQGVRRWATNKVSENWTQFFPNYGTYSIGFTFDFDDYGYEWTGSGWSTQLSLFDYCNDGGPTTQEGQIKTYDSGGPTLIEINDTLYVAGIHENALESPFFQPPSSGNFGARGLEHRVSVYADWINQVID